MVPDVVALVIPVAPVNWNVVLALLASQRVVEVIEKAIVRVAAVEVTPVTNTFAPLKVMLFLAVQSMLQIVLVARAPLSVT